MLSSLPPSIQPREAAQQLVIAGRRRELLAFKLHFHGIRPLLPGQGGLLLVEGIHENARALCGGAFIGRADPVQLADGLGGRAKQLIGQGDQRQAEILYQLPLSQDQLSLGQVAPAAACADPAHQLVIGPVIVRDGINEKDVHIGAQLFVGTDDAVLHQTGARVHHLGQGKGIIGHVIHGQNRIIAPCIGPDGGKELHKIRPEHGDIHIIVPGDEALVAHSTDEGTVHQVIFQPVFSAFIPDIAKHTQLQLLQLFRPDLRFHAPLLFIAYREYHKRKEQAKRIQRQKLERIKKEQYQLSLAQIEKNKKEIEILEFSLREAETTQNQLQQDLLNAQKKLIEKNSEQIEARQKVQDQAEAKLKQSEIYKKFHSVLKGEEEEKEEEKEEVKINNTDWQTLNQAIDETYNQFSQRLQELYPITDIELKVCLLLKINLSPLQIATIATRSKQAISSIRKRLYKKFFNEEGSTEQWDNFIQDF